MAKVFPLRGLKKVRGIELTGRANRLREIRQFELEPGINAIFNFDSRSFAVLYCLKGAGVLTKKREGVSATAQIRENTLAVLEGDCSFHLQVKKPADFLLFSSEPEEGFKAREYKEIKTVNLDELKEYSDGNGGPKVRAGDKITFDPDSGMLDFMELRLPEGGEIKYHKNPKLEVFGVKRGELVLFEGKESGDSAKETARVKSGLVGSQDNWHKVKVKKGPLRAFVYMGAL